MFHIVLLPFIGIALCAFFFCWVLLVPFLRDRIAYMFNDNGQRRKDIRILKKGVEQHEALNGDRDTVFSFTSLVQYFKNWLWPPRTVVMVVSESDGKRASYPSNCANPHT